MFAVPSGLVCVVGDPREPVGLLLTEPSEQIPSLISGFLLFLLDKRLCEEREE